MGNIFTTLAFLHGAVTAGGDRFISIRDYLQGHRRAAAFVETGERLAGVRNAPAMVKGAVGAASVEGWEQVLLATELDLTDFRCALEAMDGAPLTTVIPLIPGEPSRTEEEVAGILGPMFPVERSVDSNEIALPAEWDESHVVVLGGLPTGLRGLAQRCQELGWRSVVDLWDLRRAPVGVSTPGQLLEAASDFALWDDPETFSARVKGLVGSAAPPMILRTEPFCGTQLQEVWLRRLWPGPLLVLEAQGIAPLDASVNLRLEAFRAMCASGLRRRSPTLRTVAPPGPSEERS